MLELKGLEVGELRPLVMVLLYEMGFRPLEGGGFAHKSDKDLRVEEVGDKWRVYTRSYSVILADGFSKDIYTLIEHLLWQVRNLYER
jgi:hypothetical protein